MKLVADFLHRAVQIALVLQKEAGSKLLKDFVRVATTPEEGKVGAQQVADLRKEVRVFARKWPLPGVDVSSLTRPAGFEDDADAAGAEVEVEVDAGGGAGAGAGAMAGFAGALNCSSTSGRVRDVRDYQMQVTARRTVEIVEVVVLYCRLSWCSHGVLGRPVGVRG